MSNVTDQTRDRWKARGLEIKDEKLFLHYRNELNFLYFILILSVLLIGTMTAVSSYRETKQAKQIGELKADVQSCYSYTAGLLSKQNTAPPNTYALNADCYVNLDDVICQNSKKLVLG